MLSSSRKDFFMDVKCVLKEEVSSKTGKPYKYLYIPALEKKIFLEPVEIKLLSLLDKEEI